VTGTTVPVSVVVPTIGRAELLRACLASLADCHPRAAEVLVVDQSRDATVKDMVASLDRPEFRAVGCEPRGVAHGMNLGLELARHDVVLATHDDCTVDPAWVGTAWSLMQENGRRIVTGRVLPGGDADHVPSTIDVSVPHDYAHGVDFCVLFPNNMALDRTLALELGGFDERIPFAEDNDFCYRWLQAGHPMRYEPSLVVEHHDWRSNRDLETLYVNYAIGQGIFYAKHLRQGDLAICRHLLRDLYAGGRGILANIVHGRPRWSDWRQGVPRGLPVGLVRGWRAFGPRRLRKVRAG